MKTVEQSFMTAVFDWDWLNDFLHNYAMPSCFNLHNVQRETHKRHLRIFPSSFYQLLILIMYNIP